MGFEKRLRSAREKQGLTQKEFAEKLNTSAQNLAQYETGKRKPKKDTLNKFAKTLGLGYGYAPNGEAYFYCFVSTLIRIPECIFLIFRQISPEGF